MILADQLQVEWATTAGHLGFFFGWHSSRGVETVMVSEGCVKNPGPKGMLELCTWDKDGYGWFIFEGDEDWRCLRKTFKAGEDWEPQGKEIWDEVSCNW